MRIILPSKKDRDSITKWLKKYSHLSVPEIAAGSGLSISKIIEWKILCDVIDIKEKDILKVWVNYKDYTLAEAAIALGVSPRSLRYHFDRYGIDKYKVQSEQFSNYRNKSTHKRIDSSILANKVELSKLYSKYGKKVIAKMCGVSVTRVLYCLRRFGIESPRDNKYEGPSNPYKNKKWLIDTYVDRGWTMKECAETAGVCIHTIRNWLIKFGIRPREISEAVHVRYNEEDPRVLTYVSGD